MPSFAEDTAVTRSHDGGWTAAIGDRWHGPRAPLGGYVAALLVRALEAEIDQPERALRSVNVHFTASLERGDLQIRVVIERVGRSMTTATARAEQDGKLIALAISESSVPRQGVGWTEPAPPEARAVEDSMRITGDLPDVPAFMETLDLRWAKGPRMFSGAESDIELLGWLRAPGPGLVDAAVLVCLSDAMPPVALVRATEPMVSPTIDLGVHLFGPLPVPDVDLDQHLLARYRSLRGEGGLWTGDCELWTSDGVLVAQARQLALAIPLMK